MMNLNILPKDWNWKTVEEVCEKPEYGFTTSAKIDGEGPLFLRTTDISNGGINWQSVPFCKEPPVNEERYHLKDGDILIARAGSVGASVVVRNPPRSIFASYLIRFRPIEKLNPSYAGFFLKSNLYWAQLGSRMGGTTLPGINATNLKKVKIPLPPLPTQKKIAAILEKAERLKEWRKEADRLTDEYLKSTFLEMFGDPVKNSKEWKFFKFDKVGSLKRGKSKHRPRDAPELLGGPYPLIQTGDVANSGGYIREYNQTYSETGLNQSKMWPTGTLCITIAANIAKTGILTFDACFPDSIVGFTPYENVRIEYTQFWLSFIQKILEETAPESAQKNINLKILTNLNIPIPPIELQNKFSNIVGRVEQIREYQRISNKQIDCFFNNLMQKAFKGELVC